MGCHLQRGRPLARLPIRLSASREIRSLSCSAVHCGATSQPPTPLSGSPSSSSATVEQPTYLGYLSNVFGSLVPKTNPFMSLGIGKSETNGKANQKAVASKSISPERKLVRQTSRSEVTNRTKALVKKLLNAETDASRLLRIQEFSQHVLTYPATRVVAVQESGLIPFLAGLSRSCTDEKQRAEAAQCLALCGYVPPVKSKGISLLSIDGGGTRGMMGLEVLEALERVTGKKVYELFDHIVGVSTGAIIATLLGAQKKTVHEARQVYMDISRKLFNQNRWSGVSGLVMSHAYYNTAMWVQMLKEILGDQETFISTARDPTVPKLSVISCIVNLPLLQPYVFRNYEPPAGRDSHYRGGTQHLIWEAIQASAAAPGYFEEVHLGHVLHQDGGVLANNPASIAVHETKLLWPDEEIHCLVSVGNGRTVQELEAAPTMTATRVHHKLSKIVDSATDTEAVHMTLHDLLSDSVYYRLNPYMTFPYGLDEINPERLNQMQIDAKLYVRRNMGKIERAAERLLQPPTITQRVKRAVEDLKLRNGRYTPH